MMSTLGVADHRRAVRDALMALSARQIAWLVFLVTLLIYWSLVPWVSRHWWLTGDEPHYLVVTHSLLTDRDLDVGNNYEEKDFTLFYTGAGIDPHVAVGPDGGTYPFHPVGLSAALVPAYAVGYLVLGTHAGLLYLLSGLGALLAMNVYLLCHEVTGGRMVPLVAWISTAFTPPVMLYAYQVYPEIIGGLLFTFSLRHIRRAIETKLATWLAVAFCIGFLPWLSSRFLVVSLFLAIAGLCSVLLGRAGDRHRALAAVALCLPAVVLGGLLALFNLHFYGSVSALAPMLRGGVSAGEFLALPSLEKIGSGFAGWLFDQDRGLLVYSPIYVLCLPGFLLLLRDRRRDALLLALPAIVTYVGLATRGYWPQWGTPGRYLVALLPALGTLIAYGTQRVRSRIYRAVGLALLLVSLANGALILKYPQLPYAWRLHGKAGLLYQYEQFLSIEDIGRWIPSFRQEMTVLYADAPLGDEIGTAVADPQAVGGYKHLVGSDEWVTKAETAEDSWGYVFDREWPSREYSARLAAGRYSACFRLRADGGASPSSAVSVVDVSLAGAVLARAELTLGEVGGGAYTVHCLPFDYPGDEPLTFRVLFTDQADLWVDWAMLERLDGSLAKWGLSAFWLATLAAFGTYYFTRAASCPPGPAEAVSSSHPAVAERQGSPAFTVLVAFLLLLIVAALGSYVHALVSPRVFEAEGMPRLTGEVVADPLASGNKAAYASRDMDENALVYGPYEFFPPGEYEVRFSMKASSTAADAEVAAIDVYGTASGVLAMQSLMSDAFDPDRYQLFRLFFSNPASQALQFRVHFLGAADLWVDKITVQRGADSSAPDEPG